MAVFLTFFVSQAQVTESPLSILNSYVLLSTQVKDGDAEGLLEGLEVGDDETVGFVLIDGFELNVGGLLFVSVGDGLTVGAFDGLTVGAIVAFGPTGAIVAFGPTGAIVAFGPTGAIVELVPLTADMEGAFDDWAFTKASKFSARKSEEKQIAAFILLFSFGWSTLV